MSNANHSSDMSEGSTDDQYAVSTPDAGMAEREQRGVTKPIVVTI